MIIVTEMKGNALIINNMACLENPLIDRVT